MSEETGEDSKQVAGLLRQIEALREQKRGLSAELDAVKASVASVSSERDALLKKAAAFDAHSAEATALRSERDAALTQLHSFQADAAAHQTMLSAPGLRVADEDVRELTLMKYGKYKDAEGEGALPFSDWFTEQAPKPLYAQFRLGDGPPPAAPPAAAVPPAGEAAPPAAAPDAPAAPPAPVPRDLTAHAPPPNGGPVSIWKRLADSPDGLRKEFDMAAPLPK